MSVHLEGYRNQAARPALRTGQPSLFLLLCLFPESLKIACLF